MYFRRKRTKSTPVLQLVRSFRNAEGQPRQQILLSLGNVSIPEEVWGALAQEIEDRLTGTRTLFPVSTEVGTWADRIMAQLERSGKVPLADTEEAEIIEVNVNDLNHERTTELGPELVALKAWEALDFDPILSRLGFSPSQRRDAAISVINRLCDPCSEHALPEWVRTTSLEDLWGVGLDRLGDDRFYRISDRLMEVKAELEAELAKHEESLFQLKRTIFLYDLTNTYFEGQAEANPLAQRGFSKEKRSDAPLVSCGLVLDGDGCVIRHQTLPGNIAEATTLLDAIESLKDGESRPLIVMDSGISSKENLDLLKAQGYDYVTVAKRPTRIAYHAQFEQFEGFREISDRDDKSPVLVKSVRTKDEHLVCCTSEDRAAKEAKILSRAEKKWLKDLERAKKSIDHGRLKQETKIHQRLGRLRERHPRVARYYHVAFNGAKRELSWQRLEDRYQQARQVIGGYVLKTNRMDLDDAQIWQIYIMLTRVEAGFRTLKSDLGLRPIFHQTQKRSEGHIFITILAFHLLNWIERRLREGALVKSWRSTRRLLQTHAYTTLICRDLKGKVHRIRKPGLPDAQQRQIYDLLGIDYRKISTHHIAK